MSDVASFADHPFKAAWDCLKRPVWLYSPRSGRQAYANPAALSLWAADSLEEFLSRDFSAKTPAIKARLMRLVDLTADGATASERWTVFPRGQPVTIQASISTFYTGTATPLLLFEGAPEEVHADERRSVEALQHAAALIGLFDREGRPLFANPAAYRVYGNAPVNFASRFACLAEGVALLAAARGGAVARLHGVITPAGPRWHYMDARPVQDPVTGLPCVLLNEQDVTAQIEAEAARNAAEQKATIADARQRFLTEMSHELRTPLNAVIGFAGLLTEAGLDRVAADQAKRIHDAGVDLLKVVNRMIADPESEVGGSNTADAATPQAWVPEGQPSFEAAERCLRALYVDDNENNRTLVRAMLGTMGIICETANDGRAGVQAASSGDWDVILMDIQMPVMDGVTAARRIRALDGQTASIPIIALTANTLANQIQTYVEAGMDDCVAKPVNMVELLTKTSHWARRGRRDAAMDEGLAAQA